MYIILCCGVFVFCQVYGTVVANVHNFLTHAKPRHPVQAGVLRTQTGIDSPESPRLQLQYESSTHHAPSGVPIRIDSSLLTTTDFANSFSFSHFHIFSPFSPLEIKYIFRAKSFEYIFKNGTTCNFCCQTTNNWQYQQS